METAVQVVWWIGLVAALGLTVVALKLLSGLLRTLGQLRALADRIATAADGLAGALSGPLRLAEAAEAADGMWGGATALQEAAGRVRSAVGGKRPRREEFEPKPQGDGFGAGELGGAAGGPATGGGEE
ncbi:MAG: hypothetical protein KY466_13940 [Gemmatimonadetes bacterium]|nr:hypothetical protein [Gemmatimonadota bacterium]